jgi:tRNA 5-methylaminomethyl-2-thiouridine biosynthesis bifunctional protein
MPYITTRHSTTHTIYSTGFEYSYQLLTSTLAHHQLLRCCGGIQLPSTPRLKNTLNGTEPLLTAGEIVRIDRLQGSMLCGIELPCSSFFIPQAGYVNPRELVQALLSPSGEGQRKPVVYTSSSVVRLSRSGHDWACELRSGKHITARYVVLCAAYESAGLELTKWLPLEPIRGQTAIVYASRQSSSLRTVICFNGYLTPSESGEHLLGAHYRHADMREYPAIEDTQDIVSRCQHWLPQLGFCASNVSSSRVCFRTSTIDRLPYIGAVPDVITMAHEAASFRSGTDLHTKVPLRHLPGLFISAGHGSRGLLSCPAAGEIIARLISNESLEELSLIANLCSPDRLAHRLL